MNPYHPHLARPVARTVGLPLVDSRIRGLHHHPMMQYIPNHIIFADPSEYAPPTTSPFLHRPTEATSPRMTMPPTQFINPADAYNTSVAKKKGVTLHRQPVLPPSQYLNCREFYAFKGNDKRRVSAMMMGVTKAEHGFELCWNEEPLVSFQREVRPTNMCLQEELLRRATLRKARVLPRPAQWEKEKIVAVLQESYPPQLTPDDVEFLKEQVTALLEMYSDKKEEMRLEKAKNKGWSSILSHLRFYHALLEPKRMNDGSAHIESDAFWEETANRMNDPEWTPHSLAVPQASNEFAESQELVFLFNDPVSVDVLKSKFERLRNKLHLYHELHHDVVTSGGGSSSVRSSPSSTALPAPPPRLLYFQLLLHQRGFNPVDFNLPSACIEIHIPSVASGSCNDSTVTESGGVSTKQCENEQQAKETTTTTLLVDATSQASPEYTAATTAAIGMSSSLPSCGKALCNDASAQYALLTLPVDAEPPCEEDEEEQDPTSARQLSCGVGANNTNNCNPDDMLEEEEEQQEANVYLSSSRLFLKQMELYNSLENEWLVLEEKRITLGTTDRDDTDGSNAVIMNEVETETETPNTTSVVNASSEEGDGTTTQVDMKKRALYNEFCQRKQESLRILKRQLMEMAHHVEQSSKRLRTMTTTSASSATSTAPSP